MSCINPLRKYTREDAYGEWSWWNLVDMNRFQNLIEVIKRAALGRWGLGLYNTEFKKMLGDNITLYHTFNEGKAVVTERFNRTIKKYVEIF